MYGCILKFIVNHVLYKKYKNVTIGNYFHNFEKILDKIWNLKFEISKIFKHLKI